MAKDKPEAGGEKGKGAGKVGKKPTGPWTTFRVHQADGEDISDLADMLEVTIAELYREMCAPLIRKRRIELTEAKLNRLKGQNPA